MTETTTRADSRLDKHLRELATAPAVDMRPMDLRLRTALIAADIELELLKVTNDHR